MACPTCDHTMATIGYCDGGTVYHCERCGTIKHSGQFIDPPRICVPKLVERCRLYQKQFHRENIAQFYRNTWRHLGIEESINLPDQRPSNRSGG